jgi:hypothetical protein
MLAELTRVAEIRDPATLPILAASARLLSWSFGPVGLLACLVGPPWIAHARGRRVWPWLVGGILLGPIAFLVTVLPSRAGDPARGSGAGAAR